MAAQHDDDERPTESTPLILRRSTVHSQLSPASSLPPITPAVNHIRLHGIQAVDEDASLFSLAHSASLAQRISFKIIVLSQLYIISKAPPVDVGMDVWEQWSRERRPPLDAEDLQRRIVSVWEGFLEVSRNTQEIEECLWSPFALEDGKPHTVRGRSLFLCARTIILTQFSSVCPSTSVVDILRDPDAPPVLVSHRLILLSLSHTWTRGRVVTPAGSLFSRILQRFRLAATPRCVTPLL